MSKQYPIQSERTPYNGKPSANDTFLDELIRTNERPTRAMPTLPYYKLAAVLVWLGAVYTTYLMITSLQVGTPLVIALPVALGVQFVFTMAEKPIMNGRAGIFTYAVFALDALINAGGLYPALANVGKTPTAQMLASAGTPTDVTPFAGILLALVIGCIIAVGPEALWKQR